MFSLSTCWGACDSNPNDPDYKVQAAPTVLLPPVTRNTFLLSVCAPPLRMQLNKAFLCKQVQTAGGYGTGTIDMGAAPRASPSARRYLVD